MLGRVAVVAGGGGVWGLGLSRFLAEAALWPCFYALRVVVGALAVVCAVAALVTWRWSSPAPCPPAGHHWSFFLPLALPLPYVVGTVARPLAGASLLVGGAGLTLLMAWQARPRWVLPAILALMTLSLYLRTLLPSVGEADTFEFQVVVPKLGVAHPTGYPLYVLLGKLFTLLPLRGVAWRLNLASSVFAVGAVLVLYAILRRLTGHAFCSLLVALAFAFSPTFWSQAVVAEVYTLHSLLTAAILWLLMIQLEATGQDTAWRRRWYGISFLLGLSLTNHLTTVLLIPAALAALSISLRPSGFLQSTGGTGHASDEGETDDDPGLPEKPKALGLREGMIAAVLFLLGISVYLFIPLRWPALHDGARMTLREFASYVTGGPFHGALRLEGWRDPTRWRILARLMVEPFGWVGIVLAAVGALGWALRRRSALMVTGVMNLAVLAYGLAYYVADIAVFLIPAHMILVIWIGAGVDLLMRLPSLVLSLTSSTCKPTHIRSWRLGVMTLVALVPLSRVWTHLPAVDRSADHEAYAWGRYALQQPLVEDSAVLADPKKFAPLYYLQQAEGLRPDLDMVLLGTEELYQADLRRRLADGQIVYLARYLPHLDGLYLRSVGPLVEVGGPGTSAPRAEEVLHAGVASGWVLERSGEEVRLLDADVEEDPLGRALIHVTLHWQAATSLSGDFVVRLRLVDANGDVSWMTDGVRPVNGLYPTNAWPLDVPVSDYHSVPIEPWLPPGTYSLQVGLFRPYGEEGLMPHDGSVPWLPLHTFAVEPPAEPAPLRPGRLISLGDGVWLTGADMPSVGTAGSPLTVDLAWRNVAEDRHVRLSWAGGEGKDIRSTRSREAAGDSAFSFLLPAGMVRSRHTITLPREASLYTLHVGLAGEPARCGWLSSPEPSCPLVGVRVSADQEGLADFGDRVLLLEGQIGKREATPGEVIPVTLRWRGLRSIEEDYTVFVHLVGPDGRLHGQADSWPVQGTYPTSQWKPGEEVLDPYEVRLAPDAPPGTYRVEVGLYQLETMERLRILTAEAMPIGDSFILETFEVRD